MTDFAPVLNSLAWNTRRNVHHRPRQQPSPTAGQPAPGPAYAPQQASVLQQLALDLCTWQATLRRARLSALRSHAVICKTGSSWHITTPSEKDSSMATGNMHKNMVEFGRCHASCTPPNFWILCTRNVQVKKIQWNVRISQTSGMLEPRTPYQQTNYVRKLLSQ